MTRSPPSTAWSAGAWSIWCSGGPTTFRSPCPSRRSVASCVRWGIAGSRGRPRHHAQAASAIDAYKKSPRASSPSRVKLASRLSGTKHLGQGRPKEQDHTALGQTRHSAIGTTGSAHGIDLHLRRDLPGHRHDGRPGPAVVQHRGHGPAPGRDRRPVEPWQALRTAGRSGRVAHLAAARRARRPHHRAATRQVPGAEPGRERLAVHARQLALETGCSGHTRQSSITAATLGTDWPTSPGASSASGCGNECQVMSSESWYRFSAATGVEAADLPRRTQATG